MLSLLTSLTLPKYISTQQMHNFHVCLHRCMHKHQRAAGETTAHSAGFTPRWIHSIKASLSFTIKVWQSHRGPSQLTQHFDFPACTGKQKEIIYIGRVKPWYCTRGPLISCFTLYPHVKISDWFFFVNVYYLTNIIRVTLQTVHLGTLTSFGWHVLLENLYLYDENRFINRSECRIHTLKLTKEEF